MPDTRSHFSWHSEYTCGRWVWAAPRNTMTWTRPSRMWRWSRNSAQRMHCSHWEWVDRPKRKSSDHCIVKSLMGKQGPSRWTRKAYNCRIRFHLWVSTEWRRIERKCVCLMKYPVWSGHPDRRSLCRMLNRPCRRSRTRSRRAIELDRLDMPHMSQGHLHCWLWNSEWEGSGNCTLWD